MFLVASTLMLSASAAAETQVTIHSNIPRECVKCDWLWDIYKHDRDLWILEPCNESVQDVRREGGKYLDLDMGGVLLPRYGGLPHYRFDAIEVETADCRQVMLPTLRWVYDQTLGSCVRDLPAHCAQTYFPRP
jgi:hypothetical protein